MPQPCYKSNTYFYFFLLPGRKNSSLCPGPFPACRGAKVAIIRTPPGPQPRAAGKNERIQAEASGWGFTCIDRGARARPPPARPLPPDAAARGSRAGAEPAGLGRTQGRARPGERTAGAKRKRDRAGLRAGTKRQQRRGSSAEPLHEPRGAAGPAWGARHSTDGFMTGGRAGARCGGVVFFLFSQTANEQTPFPGNLGG